MMKHFLFPFFIVVFSSAVCAQGIGVSPNELDFYITDKSAERQIIIYNPNHEEANFNIDVDRLSNWFFFSKNLGKIDAEGSKKVAVKVRPPAHVKEGSYAAAIYISFFTPENQLSLQLGTAVKANITVNREDNSKVIGPIVTLSILIGGLAVYRFVR